MKPGGSTLNPNAAPFVPVFKREGSLGDEEPQLANPATDHVSVQEMRNFPGPHQMSMPIESSDMVHKHMRDEDWDSMDMDLHYLYASFTDLSHESIDEVYVANNGDLDATIEMIHQLEIFSSEADQENLPDTLDIGYVPESETIKPTTTVADSNQNNASNEANASSSGIPKDSVSSS